MRCVKSTIALCRPFVPDATKPPRPAKRDDSAMAEIQPVAVAEPKPEPVRAEDASSPVDSCPSPTLLAFPVEDALNDCFDTAMSEQFMVVDANPFVAQAFAGTVSQAAPQRSPLSDRGGIEQVDTTDVVRRSAPRRPGSLRKKRKDPSDAAASAGVGMPRKRRTQASTLRANALPARHPVSQGACRPEHIAAAGALLRAFPPGKPGVVLFTSPQRQEAVSSVVAALAIAVASQVTGEILAIDGNLREPMLTRHLFGSAGTEPAHDAALVDVLTAREEWGSAVVPTEIRHLDLLCGRTDEAGLAESCERFSWSVMLEELRRAYQLVLIDASPCDDATVRTLAQHADGVYLVIELGTTGRRAAAKAMKILRRAGGRVLGSFVV